MDTTKKAVIGAVVALLVAVGFVVVDKNDSQPVANNGGNVTLGALAGPDIPSPYLSWGALQDWRSFFDPVASSSAVCSYQATATSTLDGLGLAVDTNGLGAQRIYISTSTTRFGSSTPAIAILDVPATVSTSFPFIRAWQPGIATSTAEDILGDTMPPRGISPYVIGKDQYVTWRVATATPGTFAAYLAGKCSVKTTRLY